MIIQNASVFYQGSFQSLEVQILGDTITNLAPKLTPIDSEILVDASGLRLLPGLIDIHTHGCIGYDFSTASTEQIEKMRLFYLHNGITSILPTTMTMAFPNFNASLCTLADAYEQPSKGCEFLGIRAEGPFLGKTYCGAHPIEALRIPNKTELEEFLLSSRNHLTLIDVDPTLEHSNELHNSCKNHNILASIAHTDCSYDTAMSNFKHGMSHITHLCNGMQPFHHREPGIFGAFIDSTAYAELICDGIHVHPSVLRMLFQLASDRIAAISDSMSATGLPDGTYELGEQKVTVINHIARTKDDALAGSTTSLVSMLKHLIQFGIPESDAIQSVTLIPAKSIHMDSLLGSIEVGKRANLVLMTPNYDVVDVFLAGKRISMP